MKSSTQKKIEVYNCEDEKKIQKMKFCILSNSRSQFSRRSLELFTLDKMSYFDE